MDGEPCRVSGRFCCGNQIQRRCISPYAIMADSRHEIEDIFQFQVSSNGFNASNAFNGRGVSLEEKVNSECYPK